MANFVEFLRNVPLFALMDDEERGSLAELMEGKCLQKGEALFSRGDPGDFLVIVREGKLQAYVENDQGEKITLAEFGAGQVMGEISLFNPGPRSATAIAVEHTDVLVLDHDDLWQALQRKPDMALDMLGVMGQRLRDTDELLRSQVARNANYVDEGGRTMGDRLTDELARICGSWTFIGGCAMIGAVWVLLNIAQIRNRVDPMEIVTLLVALLAAVQASVTLMAQNRKAKKDRVAADLEYRSHLKAELESAELQHRVEMIWEKLSDGSAEVKGKAAAQNKS